MVLFVCVFRSSNIAFRETLKRIEGSEACGGLPMISFLILPMQRITRLPLLLDVREAQYKTVVYRRIVSKSSNLQFRSTSALLLQYCLQALLGVGMTIIAIYIYISMILWMFYSANVLGMRCVMNALCNALFTCSHIFALQALLHNNCTVNIQHN